MFETNQRKKAQEKKSASRKVSSADQHSTTASRRSSAMSNSGFQAGQTVFDSDNGSIPPSCGAADQKKQFSPLTCELHVTLVKQGIPDTLTEHVFSSDIGYTAVYASKDNNVAYSRWHDGAEFIVRGVNHLPIPEELPVGPIRDQYIGHATVQQTSDTAGTPVADYVRRKYKCDCKAYQNLKGIATASINGLAVAASLLLERKITSFHAFLDLKSREKNPIAQVLYNNIQISDRLDSLLINDLKLDNKNDALKYLTPDHSWNPNNTGSFLYVESSNKQMQAERALVAKSSDATAAPPYPAESTSTKKACAEGGKAGKRKSMAAPEGSIEPLTVPKETKTWQAPYVHYDPNRELRLAPGTEPLPRFKDGRTDSKTRTSIAYSPKNPINTHEFCSNLSRRFGFKSNPTLAEAVPMIVAALHNSTKPTAGDVHMTACLVLEALKSLVPEETTTVVQQKSVADMTDQEKETLLQQLAKEHTVESWACFKEPVDVGNAEEATGPVRCAVEEGDVDMVNSA